MDQPPIRLPSQRIHILLPQKPDIVRLLQLLNRSRIAAELPVVHLDRPHILVPTPNRLHLTLPPQILRHLRSRHTQHQQHQEDRHHHPQQRKPLLTPPAPGPPVKNFANHHSTA
jgi:hypothetical protein